MSFKCGLAISLLYMIVPISALPSPDGKLLSFRGAINCLIEKKFIHERNNSADSFGYIIDKTSYIGKSVIYVVHYPTRDKLRGVVFSVFLTQTGRSTIFNVQNNASFKIINGGNEVVFVEPPLGGTWTQVHLVSAIRKIEEEAILTIRPSHSVSANPFETCEAYTDPQPRAVSR